MDNLTHSLAGALIGQAGLKRKTGLAMPALVIGANLPDVDAACFFWLDGVEHLAFRRGITHGPIAWVLLPLVLAGLLYGFDRWQARRGKRPEGRLPVSFTWLYLLSLIGCLSHPALDWLNVYGIRLLEPFSSRWFYGDTLFIIDVWLWALMGFATWFSLRREKRGGEWRKPAQIALAVSLAYVGLNAGISAVDRTLNASFAETISSPPPVTYWARESIGIDGTRFYREGGLLGDVDPADCDLEAAREADPQVDAFLFWSRAPVIDRRPDGSFTMGDARFYDPLSSGRFSVILPAGSCPESAAPQP
jgi:inner membrane protein